MGRRLLLGAILFGACGLIGPALRYAVWPFVPEVATKGTPDDAIFFLVLLTWPTVLAAIAPTTEGRAVADFVAIGTNVTLFAGLGIIVASVARQPWLVWGLYGALCVVVGFQGYTTYAGSDLQRLNIPALVGAFIIYSLPFVLLRAAVARKGLRTGTAEGRA